MEDGSLDGICAGLEIAFGAENDGIFTGGDEGVEVGDVVGKVLGVLVLDDVLEGELSEVEPDGVGRVFDEHKLDGGFVEGPGLELEVASLGEAEAVGRVVDELVRGEVATWRVPVAGNALLTEFAVAGQVFDIDVDEGVEVERVERGRPSVLGQHVALHEREHVLLRLLGVLEDEDVRADLLLGPGELPQARLRAQHPVALVAEQLQAHQLLPLPREPLHVPLYHHPHLEILLVRRDRQHVLRSCLHRKLRPLPPRDLLLEVPSVRYPLLLERVDRRVPTQAHLSELPQHLLPPQVERLRVLFRRPQLKLAHEFLQSPLIWATHQQLLPVVHTQDVQHRQRVLRLAFRTLLCAHQRQAYLALFEVLLHPPEQTLCVPHLAEVHHLWDPASQHVH